MFLRKDLVPVSVKVIGICGGSCSGKTTFAKRAFEVFGAEASSILFQDNYYYDQSSNVKTDIGAEINFDHPSAIDFELLTEHIKTLKNSLPIKVPLYDFKTHSRIRETIDFEPTQFIFLDGILVLTQPAIRELLDDSLFIECDELTRFQRRLARDAVERGRTKDGIQEQFYNQVNPMHEKYVEPSKYHANRVIAQSDYINSCDTIIKRLKIGFTD